MDNPARILVVDDEGPARMALAELLRDAGYLVDTASDGFKALSRAEEVRLDLVLTDLRMPSMDGLELIRRLRRSDIDTPVVVMTAFGSVDSALSAMREQAADFVVKPLDMDRLLAVVARVIGPPREGSQPEPARVGPEPVAGVVAESHEMQDCLHRLLRIAPTRANVYLFGEPGTGRARLARVIHERSPCAEGPFVHLGCRAVAERGAEISRDEVKASVARALGGTLYVSDLDALPAETQGALLDALPTHADGGKAVRVVSSGCSPPSSLATSPHFRADLARLLCVVELRVPTLRERRDDLALLARSLLGVAGPGLSAEAVNRLRRHDWPENIPELGRVLEEARARSASGLIRADHLTFPKSAAPPRPMIPGARLSDIERYAILETLAANGGSTSRAARVLGISVRKIQYKLHEYGAARAELKRTALG
ncbi:MAG: sigma-54-dependent Fis family transcriptional regulator [Polyangiaceae bacterium]|nr:sigma-54-dependent Fis family transcriptional regulator [Polyangiaceae bacterium]